MSIAEKLVTIAENQERVYDAGKTNGKQFLNGVTAIRFDDLNLIGEKEFEINVPLITDYYLMFRCVSGVVNTTVEHLTIGGGNPTNLGFLLQCPLYCDNTLKRVTLNFDTAKCTTYQNAFACRTSLEVIDGTPLDCSSAKTGDPFGLTFNYCYALKEIRFVPNTIFLTPDFYYCRVLSNESVQSIIDGLADLTGATAQSVRFANEIGAKLTDAQKATITAKNWTLVY